MKRAWWLLVGFSMLACTFFGEENSPSLAGDPVLDLGVRAGLSLVARETGAVPTGYAFFDLRGIRDSSLMALLENYGGTLDVSDCMRSVLENAESVQVVLESSNVIAFSRQKAMANGFSGIIHVEGTDMAALPACGFLGANWRKNPDGSYTGTFGKFAPARSQWPFPRRRGGFILWGADANMDMRLVVGLEDGLQARVRLVFRSEAMAQGVEKQARMFLKQLQASKRGRELADKIRMHREASRFELAVDWSRHDVRQFLQALSRRR